MGNGRHHEAKKFDEKLETDRVFKDRRRSGSRMEPRQQLKETRTLAIIPGQMACGSQSEECWSCRAFLTVTTRSKGMLDQTVTKDLKGLLR
jgi:hypothetical protein